MSQTYKYHVQNIGLGDLTFFCGNVLLQHEKGSNIHVKLDEHILNSYRKGSRDYHDFCIKYISYILSDYTIIPLVNNEDTQLSWGVDFNVYQKIFCNQEIVEHFRNKFSSVDNEYTDYIVVVTKVRELYLDYFKLIFPNFINTLNNTKSKIILIGEREIKYEGEYVFHGSNAIYSIYNEIMQRVDKSKIVDLTEQTYEFEEFNLNKLLKNIGIIYNSKNVFVFGGGGLFCTSVFSDKLISFCSDEIQKYFNPDGTRNIFHDINKFNNTLTNV